MRSVELGQTGLRSSVLGFGCSTLMGSTGRSDSLRALGAAWEAGITFYDTARSYGYGESEALLGQFLRTRRDQAIVSTKFGILPSRQHLLKRLAKPAARVVLSLVPASRRLLVKMAAGQVTPNHFTLSVLHQSVHESLRQLRTDRIDLLFMHAAPASVLEQDDLLAALGDLVASGKVRVAGISADLPVIDLTLRRRPSPLRALQFPCNVFDLSAVTLLRNSQNDGFATVANHPFGGPDRVQEGRALLRQIAGSATAPAELRAKLDTVADAVLADVVLNTILCDSGIDVVVSAMTKPRHVANNANAIVMSRFTKDDIAWLRSAVQRTAPAAT